MFEMNLSKKGLPFHIIIDKDSIHELIEKYTEDKEMDKAYNYYKVLTSKDTIIKRHEIKDLGNIEVLVLLEQGFHKRALISRINGMKIFDMAYISTDIPFAAIVRLVDEKVNSFFRLLEPPAHNKWVPDLYEKNKSLANRRVREIRGAIKEIVQELGQSSISDEMDIKGLGSYLPDMEDVFDSKEKEKEEKKNHSILDLKEVTNKKEEVREKTIEEIDDGKFDESGEYDGGNSDGPPNDSDGGEGIGGSYTDGGDNKASKIKILSIVDKRVIYMGDNLYSVLLNVKNPYKEGYLKFKIVGESSNEKVIVLDALNESGFELNVEKSDKVKFINNNLETNIGMMIEIDYNEPCSLEVDYYVYTK